MSVNVKVNDLERALAHPAGVAVTVTLNTSVPFASYVPLISPVLLLILSPAGSPEAE